MPANDVLKKKAFAIAQAIEKMSADERTQQPTAIYGEDYNKLRDMVASGNPGLVDLLPPKVKIEEYGMGGEMFSTQRYSEILGFCRQIVELL